MDYQTSGLKLYTVGVVVSHDLLGKSNCGTIKLSRVIRSRVLLPESFIWVRLFQICTFGAYGSSDFSRSMLDD